MTWKSFMFWRHISKWWARRNERKQKEQQAEDRFKALFKEAEKRRGALTDAVQELRAGREMRQTESLRRPRLHSHPEPAHQE